MRALTFDRLWIGPACTVALLAALWWFGAVHGAAPILGRHTGWLGLALFTCTLLLMVRVPLVAAAFGGLDHQYRWHHMLGLLTYLMLWIHAFATAAPLIAEQRWQQTIALWSSGLTAYSGWAAVLLLLIPLVVTFCMPHIQFDRWMLWHRSTFAAGMVGLIHVASVQPKAVALWLCAGLMISAGILRAHAYSARAGKRYTVSAVSHPAADTVDIELHPLDQPIPPLPGAYVFVAFYSDQHNTACGGYHPFSISARHDDAVRISVKALGDCTRQMQHLRPGVLARVQGPFGTLFRAPASAKPEIWVAGGIGIAPFLGRLAQLPPDANIHLAYLYRSDDDALHLDELETAQKRVAGLHVWATATVAPSADTLTAWMAGINDLKECNAYLCGPLPLIDLAQAALKKCGVPSARIHAERFDTRES